MSGRIPDEIIEQIRNEVDILEVVQRYVSLKKSGKNYFGLCPFHSEKTPSFSVSPDKQIYYCFGCHKGGDVFQFLIEIEQIPFYEAVSLLAEKVGISLPEPTHDASNQIMSERERQVRKALELAAKLFHYMLTSTKNGQNARRYLQKRHIQSETIKQFQLGYAPNSFDFLLSFLRKRGFHEEVMLEAGLISEKQTHGKSRYFDRFRDRLMFPIHDWRGNVIGFGGRALQDDQVPKYLNSPETPLFQKGRFLFNFHQARSAIRQEQQLVLMEGYMDVIQAWQAGVKNSVATLGTALTEPQARKIAQNTETVILCYDADNAGQQAALRGIELLKNRDCVVKVAQMPPGLDPDDYIQQYGEKDFREEILMQALSSTHFRLERIKRHFNLADEDQRLKCLEESIQVIAELTRAVERDHYLRKLAKEFQVSLDALKTELNKYLRQKQKRPFSSSSPSLLVANRQGKRILSAVEQAERYLIAHMMKSRSVTEWVKMQLGADFQGEVYAALAAYLYRYYQQGQEEDVSRFISTLDDPMLKAKASELAMLDISDTIRKEELQDYVQQIKKSAVEEKLNEQKQQVEQLSATDPIQAAKMYKEILSQRKQFIEEKKTSH